MNRTYRWLDAPPKLFGFTFGQWVMLILAIAAGYGCVRVLHVPLKVAVSAGVFVIGLPAALVYLSEGGRLHLGTLLLDAVRWAFAPRALGVGAGQDPRGLPSVRVQPSGDGVELAGSEEQAGEALGWLVGEDGWGSEAR